MNRSLLRRSAVGVAIACAVVAVASLALEQKSDMIPDPKQIGGEPDGVVQVANLVYAGVKSSHCFSDHFLVTAEQESAISISNVMIVCPTCGPSRIGHEVKGEKRLRICRKCDAPLDK